MPAYNSRVYIDGTNTPRNRLIETSIGGNDNFTVYVVQMGDTNAGAAGTDTADAGLISLTKRGLTHLTTLIGRFPALISDRLPVNALSHSGDFATTSDVSTTTTETTILTVNTANYEWMGVEIINTGATALNGFNVQIAFNSTNFFHTKLSSAGDYTTNTSLQNGNATTINQEFSGDPRTLAGGSRVWARLNLRGVYAVRFTATVASGSTTMAIRGHLS